MVTTKRSTNTSSSYDSTNVALLERNVPVSYEDYLVNVPTQEDSYDDAREKMRENLNRLLNYDRYSAEVVADAPVSQPTVENVETVVNSTYVLDNEDIRPTSTTMQFGDIDAGEIQNEMKSEVTAHEGYKLSSKGKLLVVLYSLVVAVVMALIMVNTGVLTGLNTAKAQALSTLNEKQGIYAEIVAENEELANPENIINWAENNGMIK